MNIIDNQNRNILDEGRNYGMGFAFLKKLDNETFETVQPISACKDYLNDVVYSEHTGKPCQAYGLHYSKQGIFNEELVYLAISILDYTGGMKYSNKESEIKALNSGIDGIKALLKYVEDNLDIQNHANFVKLNDNLFLLELPVEWASSTYMISLASLLCRVGRWFKHDKDVLTYLETFKDFPEDVYLVKAALSAMKKLFSTKLYKQNLSLNSGTTAIHNKGICSYENAKDLLK